MSDPILCLDFDGVIHDYKNGWKDGVIYGELTPGFLDWAHQAGKLFELVIYSSRSKSPSGMDDMGLWLSKKAHDEGWHTIHAPIIAQPVMHLVHTTRNDVIVFKFAHEKPPAFLTIDDRCITFNGVWGDVLLPHKLREFKPWMTS